MMFRSRGLTTLFRKIASTQRTYPFPHPSYHLPISLQSFRTFSDHVERMNHSVHKRRNTIKNDEEHKEERKTEALKSNKDRTFQILSSKLIPKEKLQTLSNSKLLSLLNSSSPHRLVHDADMTTSLTRRRQGKEEEDSSILRENVHLLSNLIMDRLTNEITTPEYIFPSFPDILIILEAFVNAKCVSTDFHSFLTKALQHYFPPQASAKFSAFSCFESLSFPEYCKFFVNLALLDFQWNDFSKEVQDSILYGILYYLKEIKTVPLESLCHLVEAIHLFRIDSFPTAMIQSIYQNILRRILNENYSTNGQKYNIINPLLYQFFTPKRYRYTSEKRKKLSRKYFREEDLQNVLKGIHLHSHSFHGSSFIVDVCAQLQFQYSIDLLEETWNQIINDALNHQNLMNCSIERFAEILESIWKIDYLWSDMTKELQDNILEYLSKLEGSGISRSEGRLPQEISSLLTSLKMIDFPFSLSKQFFFFSWNYLLSHLRITVGKHFVEQNLQWNDLPAMIRDRIETDLAEIVQNQQNTKTISHEKALIMLGDNLTIFHHLDYDWTENRMMKENILSILHSFENTEDQAIRNKNDADTPDTSDTSDTAEKFESMISLLHNLGRHSFQWEKNIPSSVQVYIFLLLNECFQKPRYLWLHHTQIQSFFDSLSALQIDDSQLFEIAHLLIQEYPQYFSYVTLSLAGRFSWNQLPQNCQQTIMKTISEELEKDRVAFFKNQFAHTVFSLAIMNYGNEQLPSLDEFLRIHEPLTELCLSSKYHLDYLQTNLQTKWFYFEWLRTLPPALTGPLLEVTNLKEFPHIVNTYRPGEEYKSAVIKLSEALTMFFMNSSLHQINDQQNNTTPSPTWPSLSPLKLSSDSSFEVIPNYDVLPYSPLVRPIAIKFQNQLIALVTPINTMNSNSSNSMSQFLFLAHLCTHYYPDVILIKVTMEDLPNHTKRMNLSEKIGKTLIRSLQESYLNKD